MHYTHEPLSNYPIKFQVLLHEESTHLLHVHLYYMCIFTASRLVEVSRTPNGRLWLACSKSNKAERAATTDDDDNDDNDNVDNDDDVLPFPVAAARLL